MAEYLNLLMRRFTNVRFLKVAELRCELEFAGWSRFVIHLSGRDMSVAELIDGEYRPTPSGEWLRAILQGKIRDDEGNMTRRK